MPDQAKKKCFVISPIGDQSGSVRAEADWVLKGLIRPALEPDFVVERADNYPKNDVITNQVILAIRDADLIVADLTGHNPNVFYELAVAHGFEKPVVPMIRSDEKIPFDNHLMGTIFYSRDRFELFEQAKAELKLAAMEALKSGRKVSNPITMAIGVGQMKASGDDKDQMLAELMETVAAIKIDLYGGRSTASRVGVLARVVEPSAANIEELLLEMYGTSFFDLSDEHRITAVKNAQDAVKASEREVRRYLTKSEAIGAIKAEYKDLEMLTIPF